MPAVQRLCFRLRTGQDPLRVAVEDLPKQLNLIADVKRTKPDDFSFFRVPAAHPRGLRRRSRGLPSSGSPWSSTSYPTVAALKEVLPGRNGQIDEIVGTLEALLVHHRANLCYFAEFWAPPCVDNTTGSR